MHQPTLEDLQILRRKYQYDPEIGAVVSAKTGKPITKNNGKYIQVRFGNYTAVAQKVVWYLVLGTWPECGIDHKDGMKLNNRFSNLRLADQSQNMQNRKKATRRSITGFLGVSPHKNRFRACITVLGVRIHLGVHDTPEAAHQAYITAKRVHHPFGTL